MKTVLIITARRFNGHELWVAIGTLKERGHEFVLVSTDYVIQDEQGGSRLRIGLTLDDLHETPLDAYAGVIVVSGHPEDTGRLWKDPRVKALVEEIGGTGKPTGAICAAVPAIRYVASGKKVAAYPLVESKMLLKDAGAILTTMSVVVDGNIVTAETQMRSIEWANFFVDLLEGKEIDNPVIDSGFSPHGTPMRPPKPIRGMMEQMGNPWKDTIKPPKEDS